MNNEEIHNRIIQLNNEIEELVDPTSFVLNKGIFKKQKEIKQLQSECKHSFNEKGICNFCFTIKK